MRDDGAAEEGEGCLGVIWGGTGHGEEGDVGVWWEGGRAEADVPATQRAMYRPERRRRRVVLEFAATPKYTRRDCAESGGECRVEKAGTYDDVLDHLLILKKPFLSTALACQRLIPTQRASPERETVDEHLPCTIRRAPQPPQGRSRACLISRPSWKPRRLVSLCLP